MGFNRGNRHRLHRCAEINRGNAARSWREKTGDYSSIEVSDRGALRLLCAAIAMQAVEDVREWQRKGVLAGQRLVPCAEGKVRRQATGEHPNPNEVLQTVEWLASGAAQAFLRRAAIPYHLPRVV